MRREEGSGWGTHVYLWWIHFNIWQNQYNIIKFKKKKKRLYGVPPNDLNQDCDVSSWKQESHLSYLVLSQPNASSDV